MSILVISTTCNVGKRPLFLAGETLRRYRKTSRVRIGFEAEEDWFDYRLGHDPRFQRRMELARRSLRAGRGVRLEDLEKE